MTGTTFFLKKRIAAEAAITAARTREKRKRYLPYGLPVKKPDEVSVWDNVAQRIRKKGTRNKKYKRKIRFMTASDIVLLINYSRETNGCEQQSYKNEKQSHKSLARLPEIK